MFNRLLAASPQMRLSQLPRRRWRIRAPRTFIWGVVGVVIFAIGPFLTWWFLGLPLWFMSVLMVMGWAVALPPPLCLALDERGVALIVSSWTSDKYLWIPRDRLVELKIQQGWLVANGTTVEQQGELSWPDAARQAGATIPSWLNLRKHSQVGPIELAAPIYLLDKLARDEIELWMYRQGK